MRGQSKNEVSLPSHWIRPVYGHLLRDDATTAAGGQPGKTRMEMVSIPLPTEQAGWPAWSLLNCRVSGQWPLGAWFPHLQSEGSEMYGSVYVNRYSSQHHHHHYYYKSFIFILFIILLAA